MKKLVFFLLCCLSAICVKSQQWEIYYPVDTYNFLLGGDMTTDGNYVIGNNQYDGALYYPMLCYVDQQGNYISKEIHSENTKRFLGSMVALDNGNAFVAGVSNSTESQNDKYDSLWTMIINPGLEILYEKSYPLEGIYISYMKNSKMTLTNDGNIVMVTGITENEHPNEYPYSFDFALYKFDQQGNMIHHNYIIDSTVSGVDPLDIVCVSNSDRYMVLGRGLNPLGWNTICIIDDELNLVSYSSIPIYYSNAKTAGAWVDNDHFIMSTFIDSDPNPYHVDFCISIAKMDTTAYIDHEIIINKLDTADLVADTRCMTYVNDSTIYIATYWMTSEFTTDPNATIIYMIDKNMNILGKKDLSIEESALSITFCQKTFDDGCLIQGLAENENGNGSVIWKLKREEFEVNTSVTEVPEDQLHCTAFPNPAHDVLNLSIQNIKTKNARIQIADIFGRKCLDKVLKGEGNRLSINVSNLENGTYCYQITVDNQNVLSGTFIKK